MEINISSLLSYANAHPDMIRASKKGDLIKLCYTQSCQAIAKHDISVWNDHVVVSRGIIIDTATMRVIARPFNKFFNEFEYKKLSIPIPTHLQSWVTEKYDGVLIIPYRNGDRLAFSSRGGFENEYIDMAHHIATFDDLPVERYTFMFELISPKFTDYAKNGHLVTSYDRNALILIGVRDMGTKKLLTPPSVIKLARSLDLEPYHVHDVSIENIHESKRDINGSSFEGWVIFFKNTFLVKIKRDEYFHRFASARWLSRKNVIKSLRDKVFDQRVAGLHESIRPHAIAMYKNTRKKRDEFLKNIDIIFHRIPNIIKQDRQSYFFFIKKHYPDVDKYLSAMYCKKGNADVLHKMFYRDCLVHGLDDTND